MANNRRPRMAEVALAAGVGTITVSRALRTPDRVSSDVRARVQAAVEATGYVPNLAAGTLKSHRSNIVAAIVPTLRNTIFAATAEGLAEGLRSHGFQLMLASSGYSLQAEEEILLKLLGQQPAAVVLTGIRHTPRVRDLLRDRRLPVVETWDLTSRPIDRVVGFSNREAARSMTLALAARGYQRIAFAGTPPRQEWRATQRLAGYRQAMRELNREPNALFLEDMALSIEAGAQSIKALLGHPQRPDAVFFVNDVVAFGAAQACQRLGVRVPSELAIAGFGDFDLALAANPPLSTVRIPGERIGRTAASMIIESIRPNASEVDTQRSVDLGFELMMRDSA
jgi:LacI family gluconate utilization system Gnt-I transcriptional repressor